MKAGPGGNYMQSFRDKDGNHFDGGKSYRLHLPANPPAAAFWSLTLYDSATRSMIQNPTNDAAHASYDELETNADGRAAVRRHVGTAGRRAARRLTRQPRRTGAFRAVGDGAVTVIVGR
jgi:hypothetical protein